MPFRPAPIPTAISAVALVILLNLGTWQLRRQSEANEATAVVEARLYGEPATAADLGASAGDLTWRKAVLSGTFIDVQPQLITGRFEFGAPGFDVVQPLQTEGGPVIWVNRGWIPKNGWQQALQQIDTKGEPQVVEGLLQPVTGTIEGGPVPAGDGYPERWPMAKSDAGLFGGLQGPPYISITERFDLPSGQVMLIAGPSLKRGDPKKPEPLPVSGYVAAPKQIGHMAYAVQWFLIAGTLLTIWLLTGFRRGAKVAGAEG